MIVIELIILGIGLGVMICGIIKYRSGIYLQDHGRKTTGKVIKVREETDRSGSTFYYPVIYFETPEDEPVAKELSIGTTQNSYPKGSPVNIIYDPDNPKDFDVDSDTKLILFPLVLIGVGLFLIVYSFLLVLELASFPF